MYHVVCVPLVAGFPFETLSYVSKRHYTVGDIVPITIGHQHQKGCVISVDDIRSHKLDIKNRDYLTKTMSTEPIGKLPENMISWFFKVAQEEYEPYMNIWKGFLTNKVLEFLLEQTYVAPEEKIQQQEKPKLIIGNLSKRSRYYCDTMITPELEQQKSVLVISPTNESAKVLASEFASCDFPVILVNKSLPEKTKKLLRDLDTVPSIIVSTPQNFLAGALFAETVIIDDASSPYYKSSLRPRINLENAISLWCTENSTPLLYGATTPTVDLISKSSKEVEMLPGELPPAFTNTVLESDNQKKLADFWTTFSHTIKSSHAHGKTTCVIAPGNALARRVICRDCASYVRCPLCNSIAELHDAPDRHFRCPSCRHEFPAQDTCATCTGTSLEMYGIGVSFITELLDKDLSEALIVHETIEDLTDIPAGSVVIGNRTTLPLLPDKSIDHMSLITPDTILVSPPYDAYEYIVRVHKEAEMKTRNSLHSVTRTSLSWIEPLLQNNGALLSWINEEVEIRKSAHLPPFETYMLLVGYMAPKEYKKVWDFVHAETKEYVSMVPRFSFREAGLDERLSEKKKYFERPFTLVYKPDPNGSGFEETLLARFKFRIIARTKNPTYIEKEEPLPETPEKGSYSLHK